MKAEGSVLGHGASAEASLQVAGRSADKSRHRSWKSFGAIYTRDNNGLLFLNANIMYKMQS